MARAASTWGWITDRALSASATRRSACEPAEGLDHVVNGRVVTDGVAPALPGHPLLRVEDHDAGGLTGVARPNCPLARLAESVEESTSAGPTEQLTGRQATEADRYPEAMVGIEEQRDGSHLVAQGASLEVEGATHGDNLGAEGLELALGLAQLREVLPARDSAVIPQHLDDQPTTL